MDFPQGLVESLRVMLIVRLKIPMMNEKRGSDDKRTRQRNRPL